MAIMRDFDGYLLLNATGNSESMFVGHAIRLGVQTVSDNSDAAGTLKLQVSNDETNWVDGYFSFASNTGSLMDSYAVAAGQPFNAMISHEAFSAFARLRWERTSGTGGLTFYIKVKK